MSNSTRYYTIRIDDWQRKVLVEALNAHIPNVPQGTLMPDGYFASEITEFEEVCLLRKLLMQIEKDSDYNGIHALCM